MDLKVADIVFRDDLYPRIDTNPLTVQQYSESLDVLPPIEVNQHNELIDGWHRWTAHRKKEVENISVTITETTSDIHLLELAIERNASHGLQLSQEDKQNMARRIYHVTPEKDRQEKKKGLAKLLSVSERTIRDWLSRIDKDTKEDRNKRIFALWMQCYTQEEIAGECDCSQGEISKNIPNGNLAEWNKNATPTADHLSDFDPPIYNIWKFKEKSKGSKHSGNTEPIIVDNLLYLYTKPFDVIIDPFAGGGSTADICKKRFRRYWVSDRKVEPEQEGKIREWDIVSGLPSVPRWKDVSLVYLDPPYWKQAEGEYSDSPNDLSNMTLEDFNKTLSGLINQFAQKLKNGSPSYIALIIQPTQWRAPERHYTDHVADMIKAVNLPINMRIQAPYESQQCNAQMVEWAKENKKILVLSREIVVWECK